MATESQTPQTGKQQKQGCSRFAFGFLCAIFLILTIHFAFDAITGISAGAKSSDIVNIASNLITMLASLVATTITAMGARGTLRSHLQPLFGIWPKAKQFFDPIFNPPLGVCFISYNDSKDSIDRRIARKVGRQLTKLDCDPILRPWGQRSNFMDEITSAHEQPTYILTIYTPSYEKRLRSKLEWVQEFEKHHRRGGNGAALIFSEWAQQLDPGLDTNTIATINFDTRKRRHIHERLNARLPLNPKPASVSPENQTSAGSSKGQTIRKVPSPTPFFIGREVILRGLYNRFVADERDGRVYPQAIIGLAGMGTTETALKFAEQYSFRYQAALWVNVSNRDVASICQEILTLLGKPKDAKTEDTQNRDLMDDRPEAVQEGKKVETLIETVKESLQQYGRWLLILDECRNIEVMKNLKSHFLQGEKGDILLTTDMRAFAPPVTQPIYLEGLQPPEGESFLLDRTGKSNKASPAEREAAREISEAMGGLPLGLELAGAYIMGTGCSFQDFLGRYQQHGTTLFHTPPPYSSDGKKTITAVWSVALEDMKKGQNESVHLAAALLLFCAFLSYEKIEKELLKKVIMATVEQGPLRFIAEQEDKFDKAVEELGKYSLAQGSDRELTVHPLVQAVIRDGKMDHKDEVLRSSAELALKAIYSIELVKAACQDMQFTNWQSCQKYLPGVVNCHRYIQKWNLKSVEALRLVYLAGRYRLERGEYNQAETLLERTVNLRREMEETKIMLDTARPTLPICLNTLAEVRRKQGRYDKAQGDYKEALDKCKQDDAERAIILNNLGRFYDDRCRYTEAESHYREAFKLQRHQWELKWGMEQEDAKLVANLVDTLSNITWSYFKQSKFAATRKLYKDEVVQIFRQMLGDRHSWKRTKTRRYRDYERIYKGIGEVCEQKLGPHHPSTAQSYANLAMFYTMRKKNAEAERCYQKALELGKGIFEDKHPHPLVATLRNNLAELYRMQGKTGAAEKSYEDARQIYEKSKPEHPWFGSVIQNYVTSSEMSDMDDAAKEKMGKLRKQAKEILGRNVRDTSNKETNDDQPGMLEA